jgi:hypothetical protein
MGREYDFETGEYYDDGRDVYFYEEDYQNSKNGNDFDYEIHDSDDYEDDYEDD